ncbi:thiamine pyrophosphate-binding protein [Sphingomonas oligophenolica]|uniref:Thiamine pyrophosphate-binding protein n=2 Tax=Sphingomonas oligophenolica TaxID=301154 RepID=A0A502C4I4_9SPHN|nr:thiamine pyrophosphate-binding protein [Sphingomonas oligophenolica]
MVDLLRSAGISYVAAMAGSSFRGLHESLINYGDNNSPELIACPHEEVSAAMCHGYAKVAGKPMACMVHSTVGLQHASMAIYNAYCDRVPMLILAANTLDETKRRPGVEWLHTAGDLGAFVRDFIKWEDTPASLTHFGESFMRALQLAMTPPYEPVLLVMDTELQEDAIPDRDALKVPRLMTVAPSGGDSAAIAAAAELLIGAEHPLIAVDRAARTPAGMKQVVQLAELLNAPVVDKGGRMNMPTNHPLNHTGRTAALIREADVIIGLEMTDIWGLVNNVPDTIERKAVRIARPDAQVIGISATYANPHSNIQDQQRYYACDIAMASDAEATLPQLIAAIEARLSPARRDAIATRRPALEAAYRRMRAADATAAAVGWDASPISTARLSMELWDRIKHVDWGLTTDSKFISSWPQRLWDITEHHQYIGGEGGYGLGYGLPASLGAALAHRDAGRIAVAIQTDGDVMMLPNTFWTMAHHRIPLLMVMHNNRAWHQETMHLKRMSSRRNRGPTTWTNGTTITDPVVDFAGLARSMGVWAEGPIDQPAKLGPALDRALAHVRGGAPALLDVVTQPR